MRVSKGKRMREGGNRKYIPNFGLESLGDQKIILEWVFGENAVRL
jgi:hypothetical protein